MHLIWSYVLHLSFGSFEIWQIGFHYPFGLQVYEQLSVSGERMCTIPVNHLED